MAASESRRPGVSAAAAEYQLILILKMSSEDQTVDPRNKLMGNDDGTIFVRFHTVWRTGRHKLVNFYFYFYFIMNQESES